MQRPAMKLGREQFETKICSGFRRDERSTRADQHTPLGEQARSIDRRKQRRPGRGKITRREGLEINFTPAAHQ